MKKTCTPNPNTGAQAPACPIVNYLNMTFWAFSYLDNRVSMGIVAYDANGNVLKQWEKPGARYVYAITVDPVAHTVTFRGQSDAAVTMSWNEMASAAPASSASTSGQTTQAMPGTVSPVDVARALAPNVHLHSQDIHRPSSVPWYLARTTLMSGTASLGTLDSLQRITVPSGLTPVLVNPTGDSLAAYSGNTQFGSSHERGDIGLWPDAAPPGGSPQFNTLNTSRFSDYAQDTLKGESLVNGECTSEAYYRITKTGSPGGYQITYYFFYPYNGGMGPTSNWDSVPLGLHSGFYAHVGDWERVTANITITNNLVTLQYVTFEAHGDTSNETAGNLSFSNLTLGQIGPIDVYSAWHSHASYRKTGSFGLASMSWGPLSAGYDYTENGPLWRTANHLVQIRNDSPRWVQFNGYFGSDVTIYFTGLKALKNGPEGPAFHDQWLDGTQYYPFSPGPGPDPNQHNQ
jgi:hypothetical protein